MKLLKFNEYLVEGIRQENDKITFNFKDNSDNDIMSLKFASGRSRIQTKDNTQYQYYYSYMIPEGKTKDSDIKDLLHKLKMMDDSIDNQSLHNLINKAAIGIDNVHDLNSFDSIVYPKSSSKILTAFAEQLYRKSGVAKLIPDTFIKSSRDNIKFDWSKIEKIKDDKTKAEVIKITDTIKNADGEFKIKNIRSRYRKYISDFLIFNSEESREIYNSITGKRIILVDDFRTSGISLKHMMDLLIRYEPSYILSVILIKVS